MNDLMTGGTPVVDLDSVTMNVVRESLLSSLESMHVDSELYRRRKRALENIEIELKARKNVIYLRDKGHLGF